MPEVSEATADDDLAAAFAERDAFFAAQQFPEGGALQARTDAQRALVQAQREWTEHQGGAWNAQSEAILLALASDTCETGILSRHRIDADLLRTQIASSPLAEQLIPAQASGEERARWERDIASMSVFGASYLCPQDRRAWSQAFEHAYPQ